MAIAFTRLPLIAAKADPVHVTCVKTACEVAGLLPPGQTETSMTIVFHNGKLESMLLANGDTPGSVLVADTGNGQTGFAFYINNEF